MKFRCDNGHLVEIDTRAEKKTIRRAEKMQIVCPHCKPANVRLSHIPESAFSGKQYTCSANHLTTIYPFTNGMCNVEVGDDQENIEAEPEVMQEMIDDGVYKCQHIVEAKDKSRKCNRKLKAVDSVPLSKPSPAGIKTKVRVGDVWDKAGCPEPKDSSVEIERRGGQDYDAHLNETEFGRRNKKRVQKMRKEKAERNAKAAGEVIDKPTNRSYKERNVRRPGKSDL